jgi:hypothetical protein
MFAGAGCGILYIMRLWYIVKRRLDRRGKYGPIKQG